MSSDLFDNGKKIISDAYHGTRVIWASKIVAEGFRIRSSTNHHLGIGVYFYESSFRSAKTWAENVREYPDPAVIRSRIESVRCLDFFDEELQQYVKTLARNFAMRGKPQTLASSSSTLWLGEGTIP